MTDDPAIQGRVVVGVDGSVEATYALLAAAEEAVLRHAQLDIIHVWSPPVAGSPIGPITIPLHEDEYRAAHGDLLDTAVDALLERMPVQPERVERILAKDTSVARTLLGAAKGADLLVVGSRGRGGFTGLVLGSVSQQCVHHASCPVLVVRQPE